MEKQIDAIISLLYEAAMAPEAWEVALERICSCIHASGASYFVWDGNQQQVDFWCAFGHEEIMQQRYISHYVTVDPTRNAIMASEPGTMFCSSQFFSKNYIDRSEYFQDYLLPNGIGEVFGGKTMQRNGVVGIFSVQQARQAEGFAEEGQLMLQKIVPHLVRASEIHARLTRLNKQALTLEIALQTVNLPVIIVDATRHVHYLNKAAETLLDGSCGLYVQSNTLYFANADLHRKLGNIVSRATDPVCCESGALLYRTSNAAQFLSVVPVPECQTTGLTDKRLALLVGSPCAPAAEDFARMLAGLFALTTAEKKLACKMLYGHNVTEAANELGIGRETVRSQLRSLFEKTSTNGQAQLVSLLQGLAVISPPSAK